LWEKSRRPMVHVSANNSPYESKDYLKGRGYRWSTQARVWSKSVEKQHLSQEISWLENEVYRGTFRGSSRDIPLHENFRA